ncbi:MAG: PAS domain S-box protein, partial [Candidatus Bathyarchaeia archaeon]
MAYVYNRQSQFLLKELNKKANNYSVNLSEVLVVPIWDYDDEQIGKIGTVFIQNDIIDEIQIMGPNGKTLFQYREKQSATNRIERSIDIHYKGQVIGHSKLFFSLDAYKMDLVWLRNAAFFILGGSIVVIFITTGLLLRVFMRKPLNILYNGIDRVAKGDYAYRFEEVHHMELFEIANRFSEMASEIQVRENSLLEINRELQQEIIERKRAEEALRESEEKYRLLFENANEAIFIIEDGIVKFPNFKTEEMTGYSEKELSEISFINIIHPDDREMVLESRRKRLLGEKPPSTYSFRMINKSGDELLVQINAVLITWEGKPATINFIRDISEQKRLEAQLQQAQKMESMGTLAGGIAHDFNNLLMGIQGRASLMMMDTDSSHPYNEHLKGINDYVKSAAELTKQLLGFARGGKYEVKAIDLNEFIKKQNRMFGRARKEINIRGRYEKNLWTVDVDQGQIEQVLLNIYVNAWHAMLGGGDLFVQTENIVIDENYGNPYHVEPGRYVKISVTDNGVGMDEATQQRIFDPFFTTKEIGRGTGLGLASAYGIIKNHKGFINVYSEKGEGTTFNIYFPASEKEAVKEKEIDEELIRGTETVFLVDDENIILDVAKDILKTLGYKVLLARGGVEALQVY